MSRLKKALEARGETLKHDINLFKKKVCNFIICIIVFLKI